MVLMVVVAFFAALTLFLCKLGSFKLLIPLSVRQWIYKRPVALGLLDIVFGLLGAHVLVLGGGAILSMLALVFYSGMSMSYIALNIMWRDWKIRREHSTRRVAC